MSSNLLGQIVDETLGEEANDQIVEACHSALNKRLVSRKNLDADNHGKLLYRGIVHFNSYNI